MKRHLITVAILVAALACYGFEFSRLGLAAVIAGGALELWFWVRLCSRRAPVRGHSSPQRNNRLYGPVAEHLASDVRFAA